MKKIDAAVKKETLYILLWVLIFSALMQAVFLIIGKWDYRVLLGNLLSGSASVLNFFFMGLTVQKAVTKDEKGAKATMKLSQLYRFLFIIIITVIGILVPCFNNWTVVIPIFFPRIAILLSPLFNRAKRS
ncbi:MAG: ATP synthase subunit I [Clostridia bacterium]|nr:ATP synthase subunit I [Clostridia bacterium]